LFGSWRGRAGEGDVAPNPPPRPGAGAVVPKCWATGRSGFLHRRAQGLGPLADVASSTGRSTLLRRRGHREQLVHHSRIRLLRR
jgi:hypothetical protein